MIILNCYIFAAGYRNQVLPETGLETVLILFFNSVKHKADHC
jgi:hypothetical protein